jgi:CheY-like chemotaxis protein
MSTRNATILLVDDDPSILLTMGDSLQYHGYTVIKAATAEQASQRLAQQTPDLIILDISMPGMGGMGFLRTIAGSDGKIKHPVLVFTARSELNGFMNGLDIEGFLTKTEPPEKFIEVVDRIIDKRRSVPPGKRVADTSRRILLVEDDPERREGLLQFFRRHSHEAWGVGSGFHVAEALREKTPDVIVLKHILPFMNGASIAQMLASEEDTKGIPVVLYDESGLRAADARFPHVRVFVAGAKGDALLKAVVEATA